MGTVRVNSITISAGATGNGPFYGKSTLTAIDLGNASWETSNLQYAFYGCSRLQTVTNINDNVYDMSRAFSSCSNLSSIDHLPNNVQRLAYCFGGCSNLATAPAIPNSVKDIQGCFSGCVNLTSAPLLPNSITNSMIQTFINCQNLITPPYIPRGVNLLGECFGGCVNLTMAPIIPASVTNLYSSGMIGGGCFANCYNLTGDIYILSTDIMNARNCFVNTTLSKNVYLPYNTSLGIISNTYNAFINAGYTTTGSQHGVYLKENPYFEKSGDWWWCNHPDDRTLRKYLGSATTLTLPNAINGVSTCISGLEAFGYRKYVYNGSVLTSINLNNVVIMDSMERMFYDCYQLTSITNLNIHSSVTNASFVFNGCTGVTSLPSLPDHITNLQCAYTRCTNLTSMPHIPNNAIDLTSIFMYCNFNQWTTNITFPDSVVYYSEAFDGYTSYMTNKAFNITVGSNAKTLYNAFSTMQGNFYIKSYQVTNASGCFRNVSYRKNVYIPFKNSDGTYSATYSSFIAAGYKEDGSYLNTYLYNYTALYS